MELLRKHARKAATSFKDLADDVWEEVGDTKGLPKALGETAGKYALTAQLLMTMNFPDEAEIFRGGFNVTGRGPTGAQGFEGTPIAHLLDNVAEVSMQRNTAAIGTQGFADVSQTSTIDDLGQLLPMLRSMVEGK